MEITLDFVRQILRRALGFESFVATFIRSVRADGKATRSAQIDREGRLTYSPEFVKAKVKSREDVFPEHHAGHTIPDVPAHLKDCPATRGMDRHHACQRCRRCWRPRGGLNRKES